MAAKQEAEEVEEQVKMEEEGKTGSAPEVLQATAVADPDHESVAEASTKVEEEQPTFEQPEEVEPREVTSVVDTEQVSAIADEKHEVVEETSVAEEPKETLEEAPVKEAQEESIDEHEKKEDRVENDGETNGSTEQTQGQGDIVGGVAVTKDEETPTETVQETRVEAVAEPEEESVKGGEMVKEGQDQTKEETPVKPVKQSNNLISKVKNSLVKAKKAIIGKSPPKSDATETKE